VAKRMFVFPNSQILS